MSLTVRFPEAGSRHGPRHRRQGHGQPHGPAAQRGDDAAAHGAVRPRRPDRGRLLRHHQEWEGTVTAVLRRDVHVVRVLCLAGAGLALSSPED